MHACMHECTQWEGQTRARCCAGTGGRGHWSAAVRPGGAAAPARVSLPGRGSHPPVHMLAGDGVQLLAGICDKRRHIEGGCWALSAWCTASEWLGGRSSLGPTSRPPACHLTVALAAPLCCYGVMALPSPLRHCQPKAQRRTLQVLALHHPEHVLLRVLGVKSMGRDVSAGGAVALAGWGVLVRKYMRVCSCVRFNTRVCPAAALRAPWSGRR